MEDINTKMELYMMVIGLMVKEKVMESVSFQMGQCR